MGIPAPIGVSASGQPPLGDQANAVIGGTILAVGPKKPFAFRGPMNLELYASVNTALTTTAGSLAASVASATGLAVGSAINSANVPPGTTIGALAGTNVTLAVPPVTLPASFRPNSLNISLPAGSNVATLLGATVFVVSNASRVVLPIATTVAAIVQLDVAPTATSPGQPGIVQLSALPTTLPNDTIPVALQFDVGAAAITATGADALAVFTGASAVYVGTVQVERTFDGGRTWIVCNVGSSGQLAQYAAGTPVSLTFGEPEKQVLYRLNCIAYVSGVINYRISQTGGAAESLAIGPLSSG